MSSNCNYDNNTIYHNIHSHNDVPIWVIVDYFDFGTLRDFIRCLPRNLQNKIAIDCTDFISDNIPNFNNTFPIGAMNSFIKNIHETRNVCAHNNRLLKFKCRSDSAYFEPLHSLHAISRNDTRNNVFTTFINLQCFLSKTEYGVLNNTLRKRVKHLNHRLHSISVNSILFSLGFPDNWHENDPLPQ